ncbi:MAG: GNAT family N-acetyltransferase [Flavobacteriaceae bacterium]|nr:GNAT family N-acetyltransferase [Flavobacteriaceae bacterium]
MKQQPTIETKRLIIREILPNDAKGMFELDSNPNVHLYLGNQPVTTIEESVRVIQLIRDQYESLGIGRWAVVEKSSGKFVGWTGFKVNLGYINGVHEVFDLGYRFTERVWGKGYATETSVACLQYAFDNLKYNPIYGMADVHHEASNRVLKKMGMKYINEFDFDGDQHYFYTLTKEEWMQGPFYTNR